MIAVLTIVIVVGLILFLDALSLHWFVSRRIPPAPLAVIWIVFAGLTVLLFVRFGWNRLFYVSLFMELGLLGLAIRTLDGLLKKFR